MMHANPIDREVRVSRTNSDTVGTSCQSTIAIVGIVRTPRNRCQVSSSVLKRWLRAGSGCTTHCFANGRIAGMARKSSERASQYAVPAGVSPLYSVIFGMPSVGSMKASSRPSGDVTWRRGADSSSVSSQSVRRNCARKARSVRAASPAVLNAPSRSPHTARRQSYSSLRMSRGRNTVQSGRSPNAMPRSSCRSVSHAADSSASDSSRPSCHDAIGSAGDATQGATVLPANRCAASGIGGVRGCSASAMQ